MYSELISNDLSLVFSLWSCVYIIDVQKDTSSYKLTVIFFKLSSQILRKKVEITSAVIHRVANVECYV